MDFSIYTLGDVKLFESALRGVAMMFTVANGGTNTLWASNTNLGVGMGAVFGGLIAMIVMIYNGALKRQLDWRNLLMPTLLYVALTGPKTTVTIFDAYSKEPPRSVSGVPLGLAFPLGMISQIAYSATVKIETVFQVPYNGYSKITDEGYVAPLKILNSLRYTGVAFGGASPDFQDILKNVHTVCLINNKDFDVNEYNSSLEPFNVLKNALASTEVSNRYVRMTITGGQGTTKMLSCEDSGKFLENSMKAYITGSTSNDVFSLLTNDELKINNLSKDLDRIMIKENGGSKQGIERMSEGQILNTIGRFTTPNNQQIMQFMYGTLLNPSLSGVAQCSFDESKSAVAKCQNYLTSIEQWKDKSAAEGTGFVSIMRDGQNLLIVLSIILFPMMVLILVIQGAGSLKIMGSFILYTVSAFMWLPVASIINYYTHLQLHEEFLKWNPTNDPTMFLTIKNAGGFYDAISQKLALANQTLASVPMICMGLFSGMLFTMNRLTDMWNHASNTFDAKSNIPDAVSRKPITNVSSSVNYASLNAVGTINGLSNTFDANSSQKLSNSMQQVKSAEERSDLAFKRLFSHELSKSLTKDEMASVVESAQKNYANGHRSSNKTTGSETDTHQTKFKDSTKNSNTFDATQGSGQSQVDLNKRSVDAGATLSGGAGESTTTPVGKSSDDKKNSKTKDTARAEAKAYVGYSSDTGEVDTKTLDAHSDGSKKAIDDRITESTAGRYDKGTLSKAGGTDYSSREYQSALATALANKVAEKYGDKMSDAQGISFQKAYAETVDASKAVAESYGLAMNSTRTTSQLLNGMASSGSLTSKMKEAIVEGRNIDPEKFAIAEQAHYQNLKNSAQLSVNDADLRTVAQFQALKDMGYQGQKLALTAEYGQYEIDQMHAPLPDVTKLVEQGLGSANEDIKGAIYRDYNTVEGRMDALHQQRADLAGKISAQANKPTTAYAVPSYDIAKDVAVAQRSHAYDDIIKRASKRYGVPEGLIKAVMHTESGFRNSARSPVGAEGLMQLMPQYHASRGVKNGYDPEQNIMGGAYALKGLLKEFKGNTVLAVAAYNAGQGRVRQYNGIPPFKETQDYVERVMGRYNTLYKDGVGSAPTLPSEKTQDVRAKSVKNSANKKK